MQHWTITREADGLARLTFDKAGATTNTLSAAVLVELNEALDELDRDPPKGLVIASGKANGFIAGADIDEFGADRDRGRRDRAGQARLGRVRAPRRGALPDARARPRLLPGRRDGAGARLPLSRRRRRAGDAARPARGDAGHRPRLGRHQAAAAADRRAGGARPAAHRQDDRREAREAARHRRRMRAGADHGEHGARRAGGAAAAARPGLLAVGDAQPAGAPVHRRAGAEAGGEARAPRALPGAVRDPRALRQVRRQRAAAAAQRSGVDRQPGPHADRGQPDPRVRPAGAAEGAGQGRRLQGGARARGRRRHHGRRHRRVVRAARPHGDAAGPERRAPGAGDGARGQAVRAAAEGPASRPGCDRSSHPRRRRRRRRARRRHRRGDLREPGRQARAVRGARGEGEADGDPGHQHVVASRSRTSRPRCAIRRA